MKRIVELVECRVSYVRTYRISNTVALFHSSENVEKHKKVDNIMLSIGLYVSF